MSGITHTESSPALRRGPYATRWRIWPPEDFTEPTADELAAILRTINHRIAYGHTRNKVKPDALARQLQVIDWFSDHPKIRSSAAVMNYMHEVRRWLAAEPGAPVFRSLRHLRCGMCSHASDRLWEATGETHNIVDRNDEPIKSTFLCARCWSDYMIEED